MVKGTDEEILAELRKHTAYLREIASLNRRADLQEALDDPEKQLAYELSDGSRSSQEVVDDGDLGKSRRTIQRWWKDWIEIGLARRSESGRARARYDISVIAAEPKDD